MKKIIEITKKSFSNDYVFSVISKVLGLAVSIIVSAMTARFFGAELKGVMSVVQNDVSLYSIFLGLGIYQAYPFFKRKEPEIFQHYLNNVSTLFFIYELIAITIAGFMFFMNLNVYLALAIILMPVQVYIKQINYIVLVENPRRRNLSSLLISSSEIVVLAIMLIICDATVFTALVYYCLTIIINLIISFVNLRTNPFCIRPSLNRIWEFIKFGFITMLVYLCMTINYKIDIQMLKWFPNVSYADIGIYGTGVSLATQIWLIPDAIKDILLSKLVKGKGEEEVAKVLRISLAICFMSTVLLALLGKPVMLLLYGPEFSDSYYVMIIMLIGVLGMIFYKMIYSYNVSRGKRIINLIFLGIAALVNIVGNILLIPSYGIWGAAIMSVGSYLICGICFLIYFNRVSNIPIVNLIFIQKQDISIIKSIVSKNKTN